MSRHFTGVATVLSLGLAFVLAALAGVAASARAPDADAPVRAIQVRTITITPLAARTLSPEAGLRFSKFDADGCAAVSGASVDAERFCRH
ncbi:MAG: hypothetical protein JWN93_364 [Hyphomicrobiales bacterium]|nr:hypothetical protein [Hyphomicrobiales bacterium]